MAAAECVSDFNLITDTPHFVLAGELWGAYSEDFGENVPCYNETAFNYVS